MGILISKDRFQNEHGAALIMALIVVILISMLTLSAFELLTASVRIAGNHRNDIQSMYVADAGIEDAIKELRIDRNWNTGFDNKDFAGNKYTVSLTTISTDESGNQLVVDIESTGFVQNFQRTLVARVKIIGTVEFPSLPYSAAVIYWKEKA